MAHVVFTSHLQRFVSCPEHDVEAGTVRAALARIFESNPRLRDYVLDDQGGLRKHVILFIDGRRTRDGGRERRAAGDRLDHRRPVALDKRRRLVAVH